MDVETFALTHGNDVDQASGEFGKNRITKLTVHGYDMDQASGRILEGLKLQIDVW